MYEVDFLPVESDSGPGSKSGDAIAIRLAPEDGNDKEFVVVIDGGYSTVGETLGEHIAEHYNCKKIDLVISTHPDADHINGLVKLVETYEVDEVWVHRPRLHGRNVADFSNIEAIDNLIKAAEAQGAIVVQPFEGLTAFDGRISVLGPTEEYYEQLLDESLEKVRSEEKSLSAAVGGLFHKALSAVGSALDKVLDELPVETLTDAGETDPRNNMSVITLIQMDDRNLMFTGDAGMPALEHAADVYESAYGSFAQMPLRFIQVPHHGSKRNVGPTILNRMLGKPGSPFASPMSAFVSSAKVSAKHPAAKVVNAFSRRGCEVRATEGNAILHRYNAPARAGYSATLPIPPLDESGEDE